MDLYIFHCDWKVASSLLGFANSCRRKKGYSNVGFNLNIQFHERLQKKRDIRKWGMWIFQFHERFQKKRDTKMWGMLIFPFHAKRKRKKLLKKKGKEKKKMRENEGTIEIPR
jgi:hypothetical protein